MKGETPRAISIDEQVARLERSADWFDRHDRVDDAIDCRRRADRLRASSKPETKSEAERVIARIAEVAEAIGWQAGVGGMETAGSIVSFLSAHPEHIDVFMDGGSVLDWPIGWHEQGRLTWHGQDGKIHSPEDVRRHRVIKAMERGAVTGDLS